MLGDVALRKMTLGGDSFGDNDSGRDQCAEQHKLDGNCNMCWRGSNCGCCLSVHALRLEWWKAKSVSKSKWLGSVRHSKFMHMADFICVHS